MREALQYMESRQEDMQNVIIIYHDEEGAMQWLTDATMTVAFAIGVIELAKYELMKYKGE